MSSLKEKLVYWHSVPEENVDSFIERAREIALEAEADFQAAVEGGYILLVSILKERLGDIRISQESEDLLRQAMQEICAREDSPSKEIERLSEKILEANGF